MGQKHKWKRYGVLKVSCEECGMDATKSFFAANILGMGEDWVQTLLLLTHNDTCENYIMQSVLK